MPGLTPDADRGLVAPYRFRCIIEGEMPAQNEEEARAMIMTNITTTLGFAQFVAGVHVAAELRAFDPTGVQSDKRIT